MNTKFKPLPKDWDEVTQRFVTQVNAYVQGKFKWVSRQQTNGIWGDDWGFCIDNMFALVDIHDMRDTDDAFVRQVADSMLAQRDQALKV